MTNEVDPRVTALRKVISDARKNPCSCGECFTDEQLDAMAALSDADLLEAITRDD